MFCCVCHDLNPKSYIIFQGHQVDRLLQKKTTLGCHTSQVQIIINFRMWHVFTWNSSPGLYGNYFLSFSRFDEKGNLEVLLFTLQSKMRANNQRPYLPKEGKLISDINKAWDRLEKAEHERELALREELIRSVSYSQYSQTDLKHQQIFVQVAERLYRF